MATDVDVINLALQVIGTRTTVTSAEFAALSSNEAIQANLVIYKLRDDLLRMAPWNCAFNYANLTYITSAPGTPENATVGTTLWSKGQPPPPWVYEYQYPVDCLRAQKIVPQFQTGFAGGVPITTAVTGGSPATWNGPPVKFAVGIDQFYPVTAAVVANGGSGHAVGDIITLALTPSGSAPIGAPAQLQVLTVAAGVILTVGVVNQIAGAATATPYGGSYFAVQTNPVAQSSSTGSGINATFTLTFGSKGDQRVILTNQEYATLAYSKQITDPNVMDPLFLDAWANVLGSRLAMALTGDKGTANMAVQACNNLILEARKADGNEGPTINDVTPDWIRVRGVIFPEASLGLNDSVDWGGLWNTY